MKIIKRSGEEVEFEKEKISIAISKANLEVSEDDKLNEDQMEYIVNIIEKKVKKSRHIMNIEDVQNMVEEEIVSFGKYKLAKRYIIYRYEHEQLRKKNTTDTAILSLVECKNEEILEENSNKNPTIIPTQRDYIAGEVSKDISRRYIIPEKVMKAHDEGIIHMHDTDYLLQHSHNCCLVNLKDMLENGTVISKTLIESPNMFSTACNIATQISAQVASSQYGGQTMSLAHLAPYVQKSRDKFRKMLADIKDIIGEAAFNAKVEEFVDADINKGVQTIQYQVNTLCTCNGQTPFISIYMDINEVEPGQTRDDLAKIIKEVLRQRIIGVKNEKGKYITPAFPKLLYVLDENNVYQGTEYWDITVLACECTDKRMVPDYISAKKMRELKENNVFPCMGCRSFLQPYYEKDGTPKFYGRFNQGVVTINLPDVALSSGGDFDKFWEIFDERLELCHTGLRVRHERLLGTPSDIAPILWQYGALARLNKGEKIDKLLFNDYSSISLGYAGLYECVKYMTGYSHTSENGKEFALKVMNYMNDKCKEWKAKENIGYSIYGTPKLSWEA